MKNITAIISCFFLSMSISAQDQWDFFTSFNTVNDIVQSGNTIWISSTGGLCEWNIITDEKTFYDRSNSDLDQNAVYDLHIDPNGELLLATSKSMGRFSEGSYEILFTNNYSPIIATDNTDRIFVMNGYELTVLEGDSEEVYTLPLNSAGLSNMKYDATSGRLYISVTNWFQPSGLLVWNNGEWEQQDGNEVWKEGFYETSIHFDSMNRLWMASTQNISILEGGIWTDLPIEAFGLGYPIFLEPIEDDEGVLYFLFSEGGNYGVLTFDGVEWDTKYFPPSEETINYFGKLFYSPDIEEGMLLTSNNQNLWMWDEATNIESIPLVKSPLDHNNIVDVKAGGDVVYASNTNQLFEIKGDSWRDLLLEDPGPSYCNTMEIDDNQVLWLASGNLFSWDGESWQPHILPDFNGSEIEHLDIAPNGDIWTIRNTNVYRYDGQNWEVFHLYDDVGLTNNIVTSLEVDKDGGVWLGGFNGIAYYNGLNWTNYSDINQDTNHVFAVMPTSSGRVWVHTTNNLGYLENGVFHYPNWGIEIGSGWNKIFFIDNDENLWIGAPYRLLKYDGTIWEELNPENSLLPLSTINAMAQDSNGNFWMGGNTSGLVVYNPDGIVLSIFSPSSEQQQRYQSFDLYPSPAIAGQNMLLTFDESPNEELTFQIVNRKGVVLRSAPLHSDNVYCDGVISTNDLRSGMYWLRIGNGRKFSTRAFVIQSE